MSGGSATADSVAQIDVAVIGAGVLGLAIARSLAVPHGNGNRNSRPRRDVLVLESGSCIGSETSSRNSGVVHAGLYYPTQSKKAIMCVQGRQRLYQYCSDRSIPVRRCGKLVVATTPHQLVRLDALHQQALQNGVDDVQLLSQERVLEKEPELTTTIRALWSPSTGMVNVHEYLQCLVADTEQGGNTTLVFNTTVTDARIVHHHWSSSRKQRRSRARVQLYADGMWLECNSVVNASGLWASHVAQLIHQCASPAAAAAKCQWQPPHQYFCRGTYVQLQGHKSPFTHLVYPLPDATTAATTTATTTTTTTTTTLSSFSSSSSSSSLSSSLVRSGGLGVHATIDEAGRVKFGPDVEWLPPNTLPHELHYTPDPSRVHAFDASIRHYWPNLPEHSLVVDYCGIRPKLSHPSQRSYTTNTTPSSPFGNDDFVIATGKDSHGLFGVIHLFGMESPGLTSSLAIAEHVADLLEREHG